MHACNHTAQRQHGSVLIVGLLLLMVLTILGITAMNNMTMEERMAAAYQKMDLAFQGGQTAINIVVQETTGDSLQQAFTDLGVDPCNQEIGTTNLNVDPHTKISGASATSDVTANFRGGTQAPRLLRGYDLDAFEGLNIEIRADTSIKVAGTVAAKSIQEARVVIPATSDYSKGGCVYQP